MTWVLCANGFQRPRAKKWRFLKKGLAEAKSTQNVDRIVKHFYEQGKTDGIKNVMQSSKNPTLDAPRQSAGEDISLGGFKVRAINGVDSSKLKIKTSKFNN